MTTVTIRAVGPGTADLGAFQRAAEAAIPGAFADDSNITAVVTAVRPAAAVPVEYAAGGPAPPPPANGGPPLQTASAADIDVDLSISSDSSVHLTCPANIDYGMSRLLEARVEAALEGKAGGGRPGMAADPAAAVRFLPTLNTTYLRPAAPILLRLPRQTLIAVTVGLTLRGPAAPGGGGGGGAAGARLVPFDVPRQSALLEVLDTLLINRTGLVQASLDAVVARVGSGGGGSGGGGAGGPPPPPSSDEVDVTVFLVSAASMSGMGAALDAVFAPDTGAPGNASLVVQGLAAEGLAVTSAALMDRAGRLKKAVTRAPRFQLAALGGRAPRRRSVIAVVSALAAALGVLLLAACAALGLRSRRKAVLAGKKCQEAGGGPVGSVDVGGGGGTNSTSPRAGRTGSSSSAGTKSVRGGLFAAMLGAGGPTVTVPPPTLRRAQPDGEGGGGGSGAAAAAAAGGSKKARRPPLPPLPTSPPRRSGRSTRRT